MAMNVWDCDYYPGKEEEKEKEEDKLEKEELEQ